MATTTASVIVFVCFNKKSTSGSYLPISGTIRQIPLTPGGGVRRPPMVLVFEGRGGSVSDLKKKEERFCQEYVIDYNGTQAAIRAGYKESDAANRATRLLRKAEVSARVHELEKEIAERLGLSQDYVVIQLVQRYEECREQKDAKNALKALELIGKHLGMFEKTKPGDGKDNDRLEDVL